MKYEKNIILKNGKTLLLRNGNAGDGIIALDIFLKTHGETDNLLSYPEECPFNAKMEAKYLKEEEESDDEIELFAEIDGKIVGTAGIDAVGGFTKIKHRAEFGVAVLKKYWGIGIGRAMVSACIECARDAGYTQLELDVVSDNASAIGLYKNLGFVEYGRNPRGMRLKNGEYQELVHMRLEL